MTTQCNRWVGLCGLLLACGGESDGGDSADAARPGDGDGGPAAEGGTDARDAAPGDGGGHADAARDAGSDAGSDAGTAEDGGSVPSNGLRGDYFKGASFHQFVFKRVDESVSFDWGEQKPDESLPVDRFSVRWTGFITPGVSENYTFHVTSDDGAKVWVDGKVAVDCWFNQSALHAWSSAPIPLELGKMYPIRVETYDNAAFASIRLEWSAASDTAGVRQLVPTARLFPAAFAPDPAWESYEAEGLHDPLNPDATPGVLLKNGAIKKDCGPCSQGFRVGLNIPQDALEPPAEVQFAVPSESAGERLLKIYYAREGLSWPDATTQTAIERIAPEQGQLLINDEPPVSVSFRPTTFTSDSSVVEALEFPVTLVKGANTIAVKGPVEGLSSDDAIIRLDRITIESVPAW
jgi:hypothetical protein